jgi:hypothetical protein
MFRHLISVQRHVVLQKGRRNHWMRTWQRIFRGHDEELTFKVSEAHIPVAGCAMPIRESHNKALTNQQHVLDLVVGTAQMTNADVKGSRT